MYFTVPFKKKSIMKLFFTKYHYEMYMNDIKTFIYI